MAEKRDVFAEAALRERTLLEQMAKSPLVDVLGVVDANGIAGVKSHGDEHWTLLFTFDAWRIDRADLQTNGLTIRRPVPHEALDEFRAQISPYAILRIQAHVVHDTSSGGPQALLKQIVEVNALDAELQQHAARLQEPVTHEDEKFGTLTLDRRVDWYSTDAIWNGAPVRLSVQVRKPGDLSNGLRAAHALWEDQRAWNQRICDYAVAKLLSLKNGTWLDEDEAILTAEDFVSRMTLESITVHPDGSFEFWHNDGDLFWGHSIQISGSLLDGPTRADIPG